jgi:peptidoglycan/LPS O-acetylase OafA/YrhL
MINTGWFTSYAQTGLPVATTMWYVDVLLLCCLLYYPVCRLGKRRGVYLALCAGFVLLGLICLERKPNLPFLWSFDGRGYAPFFLGTLLCEFQTGVSDRHKKLVSLLWFGFVAVFFLLHTVLGFERFFGTLGAMRYVRYFTFVAAPGILLAALNLTPVRAALSVTPLVWLGGLSAAIYYVHNNVMQDYLLLNTLTGSKIDLLAPASFLLIVLSMIPWALLFRAAETRLRFLTNPLRKKESAVHK